jgi:hypothetical protein
VLAGAPQHRCSSHTGQLIEAESGNHLWAERFDRDMADIFAIQDEITQSVVGAIEPEMLLVEGRRALRKSAGNLDAFDCSMRAVWHFSQLAPEDSEQAVALLRQAIALDPNLAQAHMTLARTLNSRIWYGWSSNIESDVREIYAAAARAVSLDDRDPYSHYACGARPAPEKAGRNRRPKPPRGVQRVPRFSPVRMPLTPMARLSTPLRSRKSPHKSSSGPWRAWRSGSAWPSRCRRHRRRGCRCPCRR